MQNLETDEFPNVQERKDNRGIQLKKAGIRRFRMPINVYDKTKGAQHVTAEINIYTSLSADKRGVHLSKLIEALHKCKTCVINSESVKKILEIALGDFEKAFIEIEFFYFREKESPISKTKSLLDYKCRIIAELNSDYSFAIETDVPVITLCPDSKEISKYGAHNQRSIVTIKATGSSIWFDDLIEHAEKNASCDIYQILKKADDKYVAEKSYENPQFAEDLVREIASSLKRDTRIKRFSVETENLESNHNYNAYAWVDMQ